MAYVSQALLMFPSFGGIFRRHFVSIWGYDLSQALTEALETITDLGRPTGGSNLLTRQRVE